jgi:hypothetical protein
MHEINEIVIFAVCLREVTLHIRISPSVNKFRQEARGLGLPIGFGAGLDQPGQVLLRVPVVPEDRVQVIPTAQSVARRAQTG